jgi:hypothetical protein
MFSICNSRGRFDSLSLVINNFHSLILSFIQLSTVLHVRCCSHLTLNQCNERTKPQETQSCMSFIELCCRHLYELTTCHFLGSILRWNDLVRFCSYFGVNRDKLCAADRSASCRSTVCTRTCLSCRFGAAVCCCISAHCRPSKRSQKCCFEQKGLQCACDACHCARCIQGHDAAV